MTLEEDNTKAALAAAAAAKTAGAGKTDTDDSEVIEDKPYTKDEVESLISRRVNKLAGRISELDKQLAKASSPAKKKDADPDALAELRAEIADLKTDRDNAKAEAESAKLDRLKIKLAKGKLPSWLDPTLLRGKEEDEINDEIDDIVAQIKAEAEGAADVARRKGFGGSTPRTPPAKRTGDDIMNEMFLARSGRRPER